MPIIHRGSSHSERCNLYSRSVLMFPEPTIATDAFDATISPLLESQSDRTKSGELG
ncbi:Uncharacterised protein [Mycobacteroides abscessus subsp. abscessus]|nr:Uncharacterised protein [Mycobacteroides abscessus subsp. abscessus]